ncbi:hypothetical protein TRIP_C90241 [Candidatus Zixiibacteriota bacterium]|nr:hypothetical protein TRIP_C90241 [candidate division Zixibacteria bacterium]
MKNYSLKPLIIGFFVFIFSLLFTLEIAASLSPYMQFCAEGSIRFKEQPVPNKPFEVVFTFTPVDDLCHSRNIPDTAYLKLGGSLKFISGDTILVGYFETGDLYKMEASYIADTGISFTPRGDIAANQVRGIGMPPNGQPDTGVPARAGLSGPTIDWSIKKVPTMPLITVNRDGSITAAQIEITDSSLKMLPRHQVPGKIEINKDTPVLDLPEDPCRIQRVNYIFLDSNAILKELPITYFKSRTNIIRISEELKNIALIRDDSTSIDFKRDSDYKITLWEKPEGLNVYWSNRYFYLPIIIK